MASLVLLPVSCNVSCLKHLNDVSCLVLSQPNPKCLGLSRVTVTWHLCLGKHLCHRRKFLHSISTNTPMIYWQAYIGNVNKKQTTKQNQNTGTPDIIEVTSYWKFFNTCYSTTHLIEITSGFYPPKDTGLNPPPILSPLLAFLPLPSPHLEV